MVGGMSLIELSITNARNVLTIPKGTEFYNIELQKIVIGISSSIINQISFNYSANLKIFCILDIDSLVAYY